MIISKVPNYFDFYDNYFWHNIYHSLFSFNGELYCYYFYIFLIIDMI